MLSARERNPADFPGAVFFEESGAGGESVAGRSDIIDEPDSLVAKKILGNTCIESESAAEINFPGLLVFLVRLRKREAIADEGTLCWHEIEFGRESVRDNVCEKLGLIEAPPLFAPGMEWHEEDDIRKREGGNPQFVCEKCPQREGETFSEGVFIGVDDLSYERVSEGTRGEDAIKGAFAGAGMTERAERGDRVLAVRAAKFGFPRKVFRAMRAEEGAFRFAGEAVDGKEEIKKMREEFLKKRVHEV